MKNLHKQNFPIHAQSSTSKVGKPLFCKDGIGGARRAFGSALTSAQLFGEENQTLLSLRGRRLEARGGFGITCQRAIPFCRSYCSGAVSGPQRPPWGREEKVQSGATD